MPAWKRCADTAALAHRRTAPSSAEKERLMAEPYAAARAQQDGAKQGGEGALHGPAFGAGVSSFSSFFRGVLKSFIMSLPGGVVLNSSRRDGVSLRGQALLSTLISAVSQNGSCTRL